MSSHERGFHDLTDEQIDSVDLKSSAAITPHHGQYEIFVTEEHRRSYTRLDHRVIDDPFITTVIDLGGRSFWDRLKEAWHVLWGVSLIVRVTGSVVAHRVVFGGDYTPPPKLEASESVQTAMEP